MNFASFLRPKAVRVFTGFSSKKRLFLELAEIARETYEVGDADIAEALMEREALGPTGVGHGVALPHARIPGLESMAGIFVRSEKPIPFASVDQQPVDMIFCLLAPQKAGVEHLKSLALVSRTLRDPGICAKLRANADPSILHAILCEAHPSKAA